MFTQVKLIDESEQARTLQKRTWLLYYNRESGTIHILKSYYIFTQLKEKREVNQEQ